MFYSGDKFANVEVSVKSQIKKIACGGSHTIMLTSSGDMFVWGYGEVGQLGFGKDKLVSSPRLLNLKGERKVHEISAGYANSMAITKKTNEVFIWGDGKKGQLSRKAKPFSDVPESIDSLSGLEIIKGSLGFNNCACVTSDGKLFVWGSNDSYKLGTKSPNDFEGIPRIVDTLTGVKDISLGYQHSAAILVNGDLYTWGHNFYGQLGQGDNITRNLPKKVEFNDLKFDFVECSFHHTVAIDKKQMCYVWGRGGANLNFEQSKNKLFPEIIEDFKTNRVRKIQVGNGNSLAVS